MTQPEYNLEIVRDLLNSAFDVGELRLICLNNPEFRAVYDDYSDARKSELLLRLIEHAERKVHIARLLEIAKEKAPGAYAKFEDRLVRRDGAARPATVPPATAQPSLAALESEHLRNQIYSKTRQLHKLEEQAAQLGLHTPPHIGIQIEDLQAEIAELKRKLAGHGDA